MKKSYFITGTDTNVGKTYATIALMQQLQKTHSVIGMKPIASGCDWQDGQLKNSDALLLQQHSSIVLPYEAINQYAYLDPVSPHLAAGENPVELDKIKQAFQHLQNKADIVLVEGAGGWLAPINAHQTIADMAMFLNLPVLLVVAIRLGCINHACLTYQAIMQSGLSCAGWIANCLEPEMLKREENIESIKQRINAPLLGVLPYQQRTDFNDLTNQLNVEALSSNLSQRACLNQ